MTVKDILTLTDSSTTVRLASSRNLTPLTNNLNSITMTELQKRADVTGLQVMEIFPQAFTYHHRMGTRFDVSIMLVVDETDFNKLMEG